MATTHIILDSSFINKEGKSPVKLVLSQGRTTSKITLGIYLLPTQWSGSQVVHHDNANLLNMTISRSLCLAQMLMLDEQIKHGGQVNIMAVRKRFVSDNVVEERATISQVFTDVIKSPGYCVRTSGIYTTTLKKFNEYCSEIGSSPTWEDIDPRWLERWYDWMEKDTPSINGRAIHLRNFRHVYNIAKRDGITDNYPFAHYRIQKQKTRKRSVSASLLHRLFNAPVTGRQREAIDTFKLMFFFRGINVIDLFHLRKSDLYDGRVTYIRAKTHKEYSVYVEPEAMEIIKRYQREDSDKLITTLYDYKTHFAWAQKLNDTIREITDMDGKVIAPEMTTYWLRHSWATIARHIGISKDTISEGLGHEIGSKVTSIYIDFDMDAVDEANRQIMDEVLYTQV